MFYIWSMNIYWMDIGKNWCLSLEPCEVRVELTVLSIELNLQYTIWNNRDIQNAGIGAVVLKIRRLPCKH